MEEATDQGLEIEWEKELRLLLQLVEAHPSVDMSRERERVVVLQTLLATRARAGSKSSAIADQDTEQLIG